MFDLKGKVAIVTGGAIGIGAASVRNFLDEGAKFVGFIDVDETSGISLEQDLLKQYGEGVVKFFRGDITNDEELFDVFNFTVKHHGYIDLVLNNAAIGNDATHKMEIEINFMCDLKGKVILVTGGANGVGAAAVRNFLEEGAKFVGFIDVDETSGISLEQNLLKQYGEGVVKFFNCDVTKDSELFDVFNFTVKHHGYIDLVLNNAGIANDATHKKEIEINFTALVTSTLKALEIMRKDRGGKGGTIINVSSIGALSIQKVPTIYVYCGTKSAILMFSMSLGMEAYYSHTGVRVMTVSFGFTATDILKNLRGIDDISTIEINKMKEGQKLQKPTVAASGIVEAFKKGKTGSTWLVLDGEISDITERVSKAYQVMSGEIQI